MNISTIDFIKLKYELIRRLDKKKLYIYRNVKRKRYRKWYHDSAVKWECDKISKEFGLKEEMDLDLYAIFVALKIFRFSHTTSDSILSFRK